MTKSGTLNANNVPLKRLDLADWIKHIRVVHEKIKDHKCEDCRRAFSSKRLLTYHTIKYHDYGGKMLNCIECPYETAVKDALNMHIRAKH